MSIVEELKQLIINRAVSVGVPEDQVKLFVGSVHTITDAMRVLAMTKGSESSAQTIAEGIREIRMAEQKSGKPGITVGG